MDETSIIAVLTLAFGLGMLHALDADHVMAVSGLASTRPGLRTSLQFCAKWAIGHGLSLTAIGAAVFLFGMAIPSELSAVAESLVGIVLIGIGAWIVWNLFDQNAHLHFHQHDGLPNHAHWHVHNSHEQQPPNQPHSKDPHKHKHSALFVGVLHGTAGSAPLLALIPLAKMHSPWVGMAYLLFFGAGVILAMLIFGGLLGGIYTWLSRWGNQVVRTLRAIVAASSIGFGIYLLQGMI
jgi:nickel/cobalt exporter